MTTGAKLLTAEDLLRLSNTGDGRRFELLDGVLVEMPPTAPPHDFARNNIAYELTTFVRAHRSGYVFSGDTGYILRRNPDSVRAPDVSFITRERIPDGRFSAGYSEIMPDLAIEVVSPNDTAAEVERKAMEWLAAGVRLVLVVYPATRSVFAYRSPTDVRRFTEADTLDAEPVLPGFSCPVARLFQMD